MKQEMKKLLGIGAVIFTTLAIGAIVTISVGNNPAGTKGTKADEKLLMNADSHSTAEALYNYKVTVVEFGDYQCPACGFMNMVLKQVLSEYPHKINFIFRNFTIPKHKNALLAANAAEAADEQGKFWEMHDKLYETQQAWSESDQALVIFTGYAKDLGLDPDKFKKAVESQKFLDRIKQDQSDYMALQIEPPHTPTIFINNQEYKGNLSYAGFKTVIEQAFKP